MARSLRPAARAATTSLLVFEIPGDLPDVRLYFEDDGWIPRGNPDDDEVEQVFNDFLRLHAQTRLYDTL